MAHNLKMLSCAGMATVTTVSISTAETWTETNDKGLFIYIIGNGATGELTLVCDPEHLWGAPEQGLRA